MTKFDLRAFDAALKAIDSPPVKPHPSVYQHGSKKPKNKGLGVGMNFSYEKNLEIARKRLEENYFLAVKQIRFLTHFSWIRHIPKRRQRADKVKCDCLACRLIKDLEID